MASEKFPFNRVMWTAGSDNMGGLSTRVYFAPQGCIASAPPFETDGITMAGQWEFKDPAKQGFVEIYVTYKSGDLKSEPVGDVDGVCSKKTGSFFHPGNTTEMARFARAVQNTPGVFIAVDTEGNQVVIGDVVNPATVKATHNFGKSPEDRKGWTVSYEAYSTHPVVFYRGDIPLAPDATPAPTNP